MASVHTTRMTTGHQVLTGLLAMSAVLVLGGSWGLATTLGVDHRVWAAPTPYFGVLGVSALGFLAGLFVLPRLGVISFSVVKTASVAGVGVVLLLGTFLAAQSYENAARARQLSAALEKNRAESAALQAVFDRMIVKIADLETKLEAQADGPEAKKTRDELAALKTQAEEVKTQLNALSEQRDAIQSGDDEEGDDGKTPAEGKTPASGKTPPASGGQKPPADDPAGTTPSEPGGNPGSTNPVGGAPGDGSTGGGEPGNGGSGGGSNRDRELVAGLAMAALVAAPVGVILKILLPKLLNILGSSKELKPIFEAIKEAEAAGGRVPVEKIINNVKAAKDPAAAAEAWRLILADPDIRKTFSEEDVKALEAKLNEVAPPKPEDKDKGEDPKTPGDDSVDRPA